MVSATNILTEAQAAVGGAVGRLGWTYSSGTTTNNIDPVNFKGDFCRLYNLLVEGVFRYSQASTENEPMTLRLVVVQLTRSRATDATTDDIFRRSNTALDDNTIQGNAIAVFGPLQDGVSSIGRILLDRRYMLQPGHRETVRVRFNLRGLSNYRRDTHGLGDVSSEGVPQGRIYVFYGVSYNGGQDADVAQLVLNAKLAYPDN